MHTTEYKVSSISIISLHLQQSAQKISSTDNQVVFTIIIKKKGNRKEYICFPNHILNTRHAQSGQNRKYSQSPKCQPLIQSFVFNGPLRLVLYHFIKKKKKKTKKHSKGKVVRGHLSYGISFKEKGKRKKQTFGNSFLFFFFSCGFTNGSLISSVACVSVWHFIRCNHSFTLGKLLNTDDDRSTLLSTHYCP